MLALSSIAMVAARTDPAKAEQISRSIHHTQELGRIALTLARTDPSRAKLIASATGDGYLQALVSAVVAVRVDPSNARKAIEKALAASSESPTHVIEVAVVATVIDPDWAEKIARKAGDHVGGTYSGRYGTAVVRQQPPGSMRQQSRSGRRQPPPGSMRQQSRSSRRQPHQQYWDVRALADLANVYRDSTQDQI
jgi:hypothetical protein